MLENILFQTKLVAELRKDFALGHFPNSILLYGDVLTGKSTVALELARSLTCLSTAEWNCNCSSCKKQRYLSHVNTLLLGAQDFLDEIRLCASYILATEQVSRPIRYLWLRALRKMFRRFDPLLWEDHGFKSDKERKARTALEKSMVLLENFELEQDLEPLAKRGKQVAELIKIAEQVQSAIPKAIPIHQVRAIGTWAHSTDEDNKVVILEAVENMQAAASNAMLKLLEEPPRALFLILTSRNKNIILPTILSRVRQYQVHNRSEEQQQNIIKKIFRDDKLMVHSLEDFFLGREFLENLENNVSIFYKGIENREAFDRLGLNLKAEHFRLFLVHISELLRERMFDKTTKLEDYELWTKTLAEISLWRNTYNQNYMDLLEHLYYSILAA